MGALGMFVNSAEGARSATMVPRPDAFAPFKAAVAFSNVPLEGRVAVNGQVSVDRTIALTPINHSLRRYMRLGAVTRDTNGQWRIRRIAVYPAILTSAQLQRLTA
jgi:hypothetical protein